ncbi:MAG: zf-HC2 domain-containing protein [Desulfomonilaceae bacterium]|jgi:hypothetical protein
MIPSDQKKTDEHPADLLLMYVDEGLSTNERRLVENHIRECAECSEEIESLGLVVNILRTDKGVFCPEAWELYEFIEEGTDPTGRIAQHLEDCPLCCAEVAQYREGFATTKLPDKIKNELEKSFPTRVHSRRFAGKSGFAWAPGWLNSIFKTPALALGAAVAAILAVILLYPHGTIPTFIGVSSENWEETGPQAIPKSLFSEAPARQKIAKSAPLVGHGASKPMLFEAPKLKLAPIIIFHGFEKPLPQSTIDSLYEGLKPTVELEKRFQFSTPAELKQFVDKVADRHLSPTEALSEFYKESSINFALLQNVKADKDKFELKSQLIDTHNGQILAESIQSRLSGTELASRVNYSLALLNDLKIENRTK